MILERTIVFFSQTIRYVTFGEQKKHVFLANAVQGHKAAKIMIVDQLCSRFHTFKFDVYFSFYKNIFGLASDSYDDIGR